MSSALALRQDLVPATTQIAASVRLAPSVEQDPDALDVPELRTADHAAERPSNVIDLAAVRRHLKRTLDETRPVDHQVRLAQLHVNVRRGGADLQHIIPAIRERMGGPNRFGHYGWLDLCSATLPGHGRKMIESLARLGQERRGEQVATAAMLLHLQAAGEQVINLRTLYSARERARVIRAVTSPGYLSVDGLDLVDALQQVPGLARARVLQFQDSDVLTRLRVMVDGPDEIDLDTPVPVIELATNHVGRGSVTATAGMYRFKCTNGMGGFEAGTKGCYSWHHTGRLGRIRSGIANAVDELRAISRGHVEGYKRALDIHIDGISDWLREQTDGLLTQDQQERAIEMLDDATTTAGSRLASAVDAVARAAQIEARLETAGLVESAALKVLERGLRAADRLGDRLVGEPPSRRRRR